MYCKEKGKEGKKDASMTRRDLIKLLPLGGVVPVISSCASNGVSLGPGLVPQYLINTEMILREVLPHFPYQQDFSGLGTMKALNPQFGLIPEKNKVRVGLDLQASLAAGLGALTGIAALDQFSGGYQQGSCQLACGLRYDPKTRGIYLKDPEIERLNLQNIPTHYTGYAQSLLNGIGPQLLDKHPIHTLEPSIASKVLRSINVQREGVALGFGLL